MGDRVMDGRESTTKTMALMDRADLPWRAGEWFVLRIVAVLVGAALGFVLFRSHPTGWVVVGLLLGLVLPPSSSATWRSRRAKKFEDVAARRAHARRHLPRIGVQPPPGAGCCREGLSRAGAKEFSRVLAEARIGTDVSDALEHMAVRMDSENMRWTTMAIRIQREVGGNLAETLRTTAATLREREMLRRQVRALSAEGRLSAYVLVGLPGAAAVYATSRTTTTSVCCGPPCPVLR